MSIGSWTPGDEQPTEIIDRDFLKGCLEIARRDRLEQLDQELSRDEQSRHAPLMRMSREDWEAELSHFGSEDLRLLLKFFVRAEMILPGWEAGEKSPAIWINKRLKQQGESLNRDELLWIRKHTDNRYIPNGGL